NIGEEAHDQSIAILRVLECAQGDALLTTLDKVRLSQPRCALGRVEPCGGERPSMHIVCTLGPSSGTLKRSVRRVNTLKIDRGGSHFIRLEGEPIIEAL